MTYRVKGTLKLPDGSPAANCEIEFVSRKNLSPTVQGSKTNILTSATGYYDVTLELGEYAVIIYASGTYPVQAGVIVVLADTTPGQDLPTLLSNGELLPTTPDYMQQIQAWLVAANEAADDSAASAVEAESSAQAAAASAATTAAAVTSHEAKPSAHPISGVDGLQAALDSKEASGTAASAVAAHKIDAAAHGIDNITGLREALENSGGGGGSSGSGGYLMLDINVTGVGYQGTISAQRLAVESASGEGKYLRNLNLSFDGSAQGAGGIDAGTISAGAWYYIFVIHDSVLNLSSAIISSSHSSPTLPVGYSMFRRVGAAYVPAAGTAFRAQLQADDTVSFGDNQAGKVPVWVVVPGNTTGNVSEINTAKLRPSTAKFIEFVMSTDSGGWSAIHSNAETVLTSRLAFVVGGYAATSSASIALIGLQKLYYHSSSATAQAYCGAYGYMDRI